MEAIAEACHAPGVTDDTSAPSSRGAAVTLEDVARRAGVSAATASRALGDHPHVAAATRERVRAAAAALDYVASPEAARLAGGRTGRVAVLVPAPSKWFCGELLEGLEDGVRPAGLDLVLFRLGDAGQRRAFFAQLPARRKVDAVVVLALALDPDEQARLASLGVDVVAAGRHQSAWPSVGVDDAAAARRAVDHLLHLGHRRVGLITTADPDAPGDPVERAAGYRVALVEGAGELDDELVVVAPCTGDGGVDGMTQLLGLPRPPTAVLAHGDEVALGALRALRRAGLRVPDDVSVIGVDDHPAAALVDLTTVAQPVREQGRLAGVLVRAALDDREADELDELDGAATGPPPTHHLATRLVLRGSTAPPATIHPDPAAAGAGS